MGILSDEQRKPNQEKPANRVGGTLSQTLTWSRSSLRCVRRELMLWTAPPPARKCQGRGCC
jgi:hypothetical protein